jgi:hypothetical protein
VSGGRVRGSFWSTRNKALLALVAAVLVIAGGVSQAGAKLPVLSVYEQTHCPKVCKGKDPRGKYAIRTYVDVVAGQPELNADTFGFNPGAPGVIDGESHGEIFSFKQRNNALPAHKILRQEKFPPCTPKGSAVTLKYSLTEQDPSDDQVIGTTTTDSSGKWRVAVSSRPFGWYIVEIAGHKVSYRGKKLMCRAGSNEIQLIRG